MNLLDRGIPWVAATGRLLLLLFMRSGGNPQPGFLLQQPPAQVNPVRNEVLSLIQEINACNQKVQAFICNEVTIEIDRRWTFRLNGELFYQKSKMFRMKTMSFLGLEMDVGSSPEYFWFWSRRMNPPVLHYSHYDDISKTRLKTPFHPVWIMETLSFEPIDTRQAVARKRGQYWEVIQKRISAVGRPVIKVTLLDARQRAIVGHYIYEKGKMIASAEISEHAMIGNHLVPKKMIVRWYQEDITMVWDFIEPRINIVIDPSYFQVPYTSDAIDMGITY